MIEPPKINLTKPKMENIVVNKRIIERHGDSCIRKLARSQVIKTQRLGVRTEGFRIEFFNLPHSVIVFGEENQLGWPFIGGVLHHGKSNPKNQITLSFE